MPCSANGNQLLSAVFDKTAVAHRMTRLAVPLSAFNVFRAATGIMLQVLSHGRGLLADKVAPKGNPSDKACRSLWRSLRAAFYCRVRFAEPEASQLSLQDGRAMMHCHTSGGSKFLM
jgi:hypothetical protein